MSLLGFLRRRPPAGEPGAGPGAAPDNAALDLSPWGEADRVEVRTNLAVRLAVITDAGAVAALASAAAGLGTGGWTVPAKGVPVATLRLEYHDGEDMLGSLGVGRSFLTLHQRGRFWSRPSTPEVRADLLALAGVDDPDGTA